MKKSYAILFIYEKLNNGEYFKIADLEAELKCSRRTALRYMADVKGYYKTMHPNKMVAYYKINKSFKLVDRK